MRVSGQKRLESRSSGAAGSAGAKPRPTRLQQTLLSSTLDPGIPASRRSYRSSGRDTVRVSVQAHACLSAGVASCPLHANTIKWSAGGSELIS